MPADPKPRQQLRSPTFSCDIRPRSISRRSTAFHAKRHRESRLRREQGLRLVPSIQRDAWGSAGGQQRATDGTESSRTQTGASPGIEPNSEPRRAPPNSRRGLRNRRSQVRILSGALRDPCCGHLLMGTGLRRPPGRPSAIAMRRASRRKLVDRARRPTAPAQPARPFPGPAAGSRPALQGPRLRPTGSGSRPPACTRSNWRSPGRSSRR